MNEPNMLDTSFQPNNSEEMIDTPSKTSTARSWKRLSKNKKMSIILGIFLLAMIPIGLFAALNPLSIWPKAAYNTPMPPPMSPPLPTPTPPFSTPTPRATPSATPQTNSNPVIDTKTLPAQADVEYRATIRGWDANKNDRLTMTFSRLPEGIVADECLNIPMTIGNPQTPAIDCTIHGTVKKTGTYKITDSRGRKAVKTYSIKLTAGSIRRPIPILD